MNDMALPACIFCGGTRPATTKEHAPPKAMFRDKQAPEGYTFDACADCNNGTTDDDLMIAFLAHMEPGADEAKLAKGSGLMKAVNRQHPGVLAEMFDVSAVEARSTARRMKLQTAPGQTYQQLYQERGFVKIPGAVHAAVQTIASKVTKGVYFRQTGAIFPLDGDLLFHWFTNADREEQGLIPVLQALASIASTSTPKVRNRQNLNDQFDYDYSRDGGGDIHLLQAHFGKVFGFVTIFSQTPGRLQKIVAELNAKHVGTGQLPFRFLRN